MRNPLSPSALRRTAARLRAGEIVPDDPALSPLEAAEQIERVLAEQQVLREVVVQGREYFSGVEEDEAKRRRRLVTAFHRLKKSPAASDPGSPVAERVRRIHRERKKEHGRARGRGKKR